MLTDHCRQQTRRRSTGRGRDAQNGHDGTTDAIPVPGAAPPKRRVLALLLVGTCSGLGALGALSLGGCVEIPVSDLIEPPPPLKDGGGLDQASDMGTDPATPAWRWESPKPQGNNLRAVWGIAGTTADQDELYIAGDTGALLIGNSTGWRTQAVAGRTPILAIAGQGKGTQTQILAVGGYDRALGNSGGSGGRWTDLNPNIGTGDGTLYGVWASGNAGEYYVVGTTGRMFRVKSNGAAWSWTREGSGVTTDSLFSVMGTTAGTTPDVYAVGDNGRVVHRTAGTWAVEADNLVAQKLSGVWTGDGASSGEVYAVGDSGTVLHKQGTSWSIERPPTSAALNAVWGSGDEVYAIGARGTILRRKGGMWQPEGVGLTGELLSALWGTVREGQITLYAVGNLGTVLRRERGTWESLSSRVTDVGLTSVWARDEREVYAVGAGGLVLRRTGTAAQGTWAAAATGATSESLNAVAGYAASKTSGEAEVYAVGTNGTILHKTGAGWEIEGGVLTSQELTGVWVGPDSVYAVGRSGKIARKASGSWSLESGPLGMPVTDDLLSVWGTGGGTAQVVYAAGAKGLILRRDGTGWTREAMGQTDQSISALFGSDENNLWAIGSKGVALRRTGGRWQSEVIPQLIGSVTAVSGCVIPGTANLFAIGTQGAIARRSGTTWFDEASPTGLPFSAISAASLNDVYIVGSSGLILHKY